MKKNFKIIIALLAIVLLTSVFFVFILMEKEAPATTEPEQNIQEKPIVNQQNLGSEIVWGFEKGLRALDEDTSWSTYRNADLGLVFEHPSDWDLTEVNTQNSNERNSINLMYPNPSGPSEDRIIVSRWSEIDSFLDLYGELNPGESFATLSSYAQSRNLDTKAELSIDGSTTYFRTESSIGGTFAILTEHNGNIYYIAFINRLMEDLTIEDQQFVSSIEFIQ